MGRPYYSCYTANLRQFSHLNVLTYKISLNIAAGLGLSNGGKALLLASSPEDVNDVRTARDLPGLRSFEDELKRAARRHRSVRNDAESQAPRGMSQHGGM